MTPSRSCGVADSPRHRVHKVGAALYGDREAAYFSAQLDPLTAASVTLPNIRKMIDELIEAEKEFLPQFL